MFNFVRMLPIGDNTKCRSPKNGKNWGFLAAEGDRITDRDEIGQISVYGGFAIEHKIWPSSIKGRRYRSPKNDKICQKLWFLATGSRHNEHIQMKCGV